MAPNTRRTKRKSFSIENEAGRRNRPRKERQGEPSKQAEKAVQPPVDAPVPPPNVRETLNLPIVIYSPPSYKRYMVGRMVEENPMHEPVVEEEEAVPPEEEARERDEVVGMEEEEGAIVPPEEEGKEGDEGLRIEEEEEGVVVAPGEQAEGGVEVVGIQEEEEGRAVASEEQPKEVEEQPKEVEEQEKEEEKEEQEEQQGEAEAEGENEFVQAETEVALQTAGEGYPGEDNSRTVSDAREDSVGEMIPIAPAMYFDPSHYKTKIKISTRCFIAGTLETLYSLKNPMTNKEKNWFEKHPQFRHLFHMPRDNNHKLMGMWMLLVRNAKIEKLKEAWFAVNGVPIRYGIREHALISGLNCRNYPLDMMQMGSMKFVEKYFGTGVTIRYKDVKDMVLEMEPSGDRLKMLVLYFLASVIMGQTKSTSAVDPLLLRVVDDLKLCKKFPWGRWSFDHMLKEIAHTMDHFDGQVKEKVTWPIPGFCIPMELLAFEAIPALGRAFREHDVGADESCPRMCKTKFKKSVMKGFPLSKIYEELGTTKDIDSILTPVIGEETLLHEITEAEDDVDRHDAAIDSWMKRLKEGYQLCFENMYEEDLACRVTVEDVPSLNNDGPQPANQQPDDSAFALMIARMEELDDKVGRLLGRNEELEEKVGLLVGKNEELEGKVGLLVGKVLELENNVDAGNKKGKKRARKDD